MNKMYIIQLLIFIGAMLLINYFFGLNISIVGSLILTVVLYFVLNAARPGRS